MVAVMKTIAAIAALLLLTACSASSEHNDADVAFAQQMVPHHEQALMMTRMVGKTDVSPNVERLAVQIEKAQGPEIRTMNGWLKDWGTEAGAMDGGMDHGDMGEGMMSRRQMADLRQADGPAFEHLWLTMMIEHHEGAITMAEKEIRDGKNAEAIDLARAIIAGQTKEIDRMKEMLDD
jgi:uncharacterized protein (DUF305 family)